MAKNNSEFSVHVHGTDGQVVSVAPGDELPSGVTSKNPYVTGKQKEDDESEEATTVVPEEESAPRRTRKS